jgi:hypothetical protein
VVAEILDSGIRRWRWTSSWNGIVGRVAILRASTEEAVGCGTGTKSGSEGRRSLAVKNVEDVAPAVVRCTDGPIPLDRRT